MQDRMIEETQRATQAGREILARAEANRAKRRKNRRRTETIDADQHRAFRPRRRTKK